MSGELTTTDCRNGHHGRRCGMRPCDCVCHPNEPTTDCGSSIQIHDDEAHAYAVCLRPAGHDEPHGNGDLRWARLDQQYGRPIDSGGGKR